MVELIQPKAIFFENVRGFAMKFKANPEAGLAYSELVTKKLRDLGYSDTRGEIIDMSDYGVPQRRHRFIVIATRDGVADEVFSTLDTHLPQYLAAKGIPRKNSVRSALSDLRHCHGVTTCPDSPRFDSGVASRASTGLQKYLREQSKRHSPDSHRFVKHTKQVKDVFLLLLSKAPRNKCILGVERNSFGLKKRSVTVLMGNSAAPTVTTIPDDFIHYSEPRVMTVRECARLQTFPDWFEFKGPYTTGGKQRTQQVPRYTQVGNAVPPLFAELAGTALKEALKNV